MCTEIIEKAFWRPRYRSGRSVRVLSWALERRLSWFSFSLSFWVFGRGWLRIFSLDYESERSDKLKLSQLEAETGGLTELRDNSASGKHPMTPMHYMLMKPKPPLKPPTIWIPPLADAPSTAESIQTTTSKMEVQTSKTQLTDSIIYV